MKKIKNTYKDPIIYTGTVFEYDTYEDFTDTELLEEFKIKKELCHKRLWSGSSRDWIASKIRLYGVFVSKPELFTIVTPAGLHTPFSFYDIDLVQNAIFDNNSNTEDSETIKED